MKTRTTQHRIGAVSLLRATVLVSLLTSLAALPPGRYVGIEPAGSGLNLQLPGIQDAVYRLDVKSNMTDTAWRPLGTLTGVVGVTTWPLPPSDALSQFYRVQFPQPKVLAGEPAAYAESTGGPFLYVTGEFFYPGDQLWVQGVALSNVTFLSSTLMRADLPPSLPPGRYDVQIANGHGGAPLATLPAALEVTDAAADPYRLLYEPPAWPPAGPASKRGYDYYKAQSDMSAASLAVDGHVTVLKAHAGSGADGHVTVLKARAGSGADGHVTVLKSHGGDDDGDGMADITLDSKNKKIRLETKNGDIDISCRGPLGRGHVTVLKSHADDPDDPDEDCDGDITLRLHSGEVQQQVTDLALPGQGLDFAWTRTYRSRTGESTPQGNRWSHGYDVRCTVTQSDTAVWVYDGTGRKDQYLRQPDDTYTCPGFFREGTLTGGVFRLTFADTGFWEFLPQGGTSTAGRLSRIQDRNGNALTLTYDVSSGRLTHLTDTLGRVHAVAYTPTGRIASITDSTGRTVTYAYYAGEPGGSPGDLKSVTSPPVVDAPNGNNFPDGKTVTYAYTAAQSDPRGNSLLLSVTDALGQTAVRCTYDLAPTSFSAWRAVYLQRGTLPRTCVTYRAQVPSPDNRFAAVSCIVNDPVGNVAESLFDVRNRCVTHRTSIGRSVADLPVTDTDNRPVAWRSELGWLEHHRSWNRDSLCTRIVLPNGQVGRFEYAGDADVTTRSRKRPDLLTAEWDSVLDEALPLGADTDGDDVPDLFKITRHYAYDPRFGSDPAVARTRTRINELESRLLGLGLLGRATGDGASLKGVDSAKVILDRETGRSKGLGFATSETDPNGNTTTAEYDAQGNCTRLTGPLVVGNAPPVVDLAYDEQGQPVSVTHPADAAGRRRKDMLTWVSGRIALSVSDAEGDAGSAALAITTAYEYDNRGNLARIVDPRGNDALITFNSLNQPVTIARQTQGATFGERVRTAFHYDANNNLVRVEHDNRDATGTFDPLNPQWTTTFAYDPLDRPVQVVQELAYDVQLRAMTNEFVYDANDHVVLHRLPEAVGGADPDNTVAYAYDERDLLFREERAPGTGLSTVDTFGYDANGNLKEISRFDGLTTQQSLFDCDGFGRRVRTTDALGNVATRCFDASGNLTYERADGETRDLPGGKGNRKLAETRYRYDALNRCTKRIDSFFDVFTALPLGDGKSDTTWSYASNGQLVSVTDDNGATSAFSYDRVGRLSSVTDPKDNASAFTYDPNGNLLTSTQADRSDVSADVQVFVQSFIYDTLNRLVSASDNAGNTVNTEYDSCDNAVSDTDPLGNETVRTHDGLGRVVATTSYAGEKERGITINTSHVEYRNSRLVSATDGNGNTTVYAYDACDRLSDLTRADNTSESLVWSPRSNLELRTDANGTTVTNTYDLCDRLVRRDIAVPEGVLPTTTFESFAYDGLGHVVSAENDVSSLSFTYDSLDHCVASSQDGQVATATFDGEGNRLSMTHPSGLSVLTAHDALNRPATVSTLASASGSTPTLLATFAYDGADRLARITRANGINTRLFWNGQQGAPNAAGDYGWQQVSRVNHARAGGGQVVDQRVSSYDRNQNRLLRAMTAAWTSGGPLVTNRFDYDGSRRLTRSRKDGDIVPSDFVYVLDANGNRLQVTNNGVVDSYSMDATLAGPADAQVNQYTQTPFGTQTHDANGNRIVLAGALATTVCYYDYADRLVQVDALDPVGTPTPVATYDYDALGRRVAKTVFAAGGLPPVTNTYVYGVGPSSELIETHENGALKRTKVSPHVFEIKAPIRGRCYSFDTSMFLTATINDEGETLFLHMDELGNMLALTDASGAIVERCDYGDFGAPSFFDAAGNPRAQSAIGNHDLFRGMLWEPETGLYHRSVNPLYEDKGSGGANPLHGSTRSVNPMYHDHTLAGNMPGSRGSKGGGGTFQECFVSSYSTYVDPQIGQTLSRRDGVPSAAQNDHAFADNNPWSLKKEEGGRHTPFHNKYRASRTTDVTGEIELVTGRDAGMAAPKTRHDTAKNSVGNIR